MEIENINISLIFYAAFRNQACEDKFQELIKEVNLSSDVMIGGKLYNANFTSTIIKLDFPNFNSDRKRKNNIIYVDRDCNANEKMNGGLIDAVLGSPEAEYVKSSKPENRHYAIFFSRLVDYNIHPSELSELVRVMVETDAMNVHLLRLQQIGERPQNQNASCQPDDWNVRLRQRFRHRLRNKLREIRRLSER